MCSEGYGRFVRVVLGILILGIVLFAYSDLEMETEESTSIIYLDIAFEEYNFLYKDREEKINVTAYLDNGESRNVEDFNTEVSNDKIEIKEGNIILPKDEGESVITVTYEGITAEKNIEIFDWEKIFEETKSLFEVVPYEEESVDVEVTWKWMNEGIKIYWTEIETITAYIVSRKKSDGEYEVIIENLEEREFFDTDVEKENDYTYKIECIDIYNTLSDWTEIDVPAQTDIVECYEGELIEITYDFIELVEGGISFKFIPGESTVPFYDIWLFKYDGNMNPIPVEEAVLVEEEEMITAQISEEGVYALHDRNMFWEESETIFETQE